MVLAACAPDEVAEPGEPAPGEDEAPAPGEPADADLDGVVRVAYDLVASARGGFNWDPAKVTTQLTDDGLFYLVYGRLMRPTAEGELVPDLAERAEVLDDNTIEITVREGVTFHDGQPFDAHAVKAGLERTLAVEGSPALAQPFFDLESVEAVDDRTVRLSFPAGTAASWFDVFLGSWETTIVREDTDFAQPVGAGPMRVMQFIPEQLIALERYEDYWDAESILLGGVELVHAPDAETAVSALRADQVDMGLIEVAQIPELAPPLEVHALLDPNRLATIMLCKRDGPLANADARVAINRAIDREVLSEVLFEGTAEPATMLWPEGHRFHNPDVADHLAYDPAGAREALEAAGYPDGFSFDLYVLQGAGMPEAAEVIQQQLAEVGITANLVPAPNFVGDFLVAQADGGGLVPTMGGNRQKLLHWSGDTIGNACRYNDPEIDALAERLAQVSDADAEAVEIWHDLQEVIVTDALSVFLFFGSNTVGYNADRLGQAVPWPHVVLVPDARQTFVSAG
jgi:ABC-type transport system substrate-binding protein